MGLSKLQELAGPEELKVITSLRIFHRMIRTKKFKTLLKLRRKIRRKPGALAALGYDGILLWPTL